MLVEGFTRYGTGAGAYMITPYVVGPVVADHRHVFIGLTYAVLRWKDLNGNRMIDGGEIFIEDSG